MRLRLGMLAWLWGMASWAAAGPTVLTYQGSVVDPVGDPVANGSYDIRISIFDDEVGGTPVWIEFDDAVEVRRGLFSTILGDATAFDDIFSSGASLWLEVAIDRNGDSVFEPNEIYVPRQRLASAAWAIEADRLQGHVASDFQLRVTGTAPAGSYISAINADGTVVTAADRDTFDWPSITDKPSSFPSSAHDHGWSELTGIPSGFADGIDDDSGGDITAVIAGTGLTGGGTTGAVTLALDPAYAPRFSWSLAGNAGTTSSINFLGTLDKAALELRTSDTRALRLEPNATSPNIIGGYSGNHVWTGVYGATIGGGGSSTQMNIVTASHGTVAGGGGNTASGSWATVGGGIGNTANGNWGVVAGGGANSAGGKQSTVGGGELNTAGGSWAAVGGGVDNSASGQTATIPGGRDNLAAGDYSFAAGHHAKGNHSGAFVWADSSGLDFASTATNTFNVRATGGSRFVSAIDASGSPTAGVLLPPGGGAWLSLSDRNLKENFRPVDPREVLARLADLPVSSWNYRAQDPSIRHMGPMAQDLHAAFGLGEGEKTIATIDADGIALAAIQGLYRMVRDKDEEIAAQHREIGELKRQNAEMMVRLEALETRTAGRAEGPLRER